MLDEANCSELSTQPNFPFIGRNLNYNLGVKVDKILLVLVAKFYCTSARVVNSCSKINEMWRFLVILSISLSVLCFEMDEDQIQVANFDVKPGGALLSFEKEWVCTAKEKVIDLIARVTPLSVCAHMYVFASQIFSMYIYLLMKVLDRPNHCNKAKRNSIYMKVSK